MMDKVQKPSNSEDNLCNTLHVISVIILSFAPNYEQIIIPYGLLGCNAFRIRFPSPFPMGQLYNGRHATATLVPDITERSHDLTMKKE
jgi:hypothetical protein